MKKICLFWAAFCIFLFGCESEVAVTTVTFNETETAEVTILTAPETTEVPFVETTEATTTEATTTETTTTEATTTEITTTAATTKKKEQPLPTPSVSPHIKSVLEGEYEYGEGVAPIIENIDGFTYVNGILIVNKTYSLPKDYHPAELNPEAKAAFDDLKAAAANDGITLKIISGYRPYSQQYSTYHNYAKRDGYALADRYSARAGHSEHQSGFAMDINSLKSSFGETTAGKWLAENCAEFGFIIRYGYGKESSTGFMYEPWHIRYLGKELAKTVTESGLSLEEFLGITSVYPESE